MTSPPVTDPTLDLHFEVVGARPEPFAAQPTLNLSLRVTEERGRRVHAAALRCQIRIEPQRRRYSATEEQALAELFGPTPQWGQSVRPFLWTHVATTLTTFDAETTVDLPVACTYDFEVAAAKYLHGLDGGEIPLVLCFSGTTFTVGSAGTLQAAPVGWDRDATFGLPVAVWRATMDVSFPNGAWIRLSRRTFDALNDFRVGNAVIGWDGAVDRLLGQGGEPR